MAQRMRGLTLDNNNVEVQPNLETYNMYDNGSNTYNNNTTSNKNLRHRHCVRAAKYNEARQTLQELENRSVKWMKDCQLYNLVAIFFWNRKY